MTEEGRGCVLLPVILSDPDPELADGEGESKNPLGSYGSFGAPLRGLLSMTGEGRWCGGRADVVIRPYIGVFGKK